MTVGGDPRELRNRAESLVNGALDGIHRLLWALANGVRAFRQTWQNPNPEINLAAMHLGWVLRQAEDGMTVDVEMHRRELGVVQDVLLLNVVPGVLVDVSPGATVLVSWRGGSIGSPEALLPHVQPGFVRFDVDTGAAGFRGLVQRSSPGNREGVS